METFNGKVNNMDAQATKGLKARVQAFITNSNGEIQVTARNNKLVIAMALASCKAVNVEVSYEENAGEKVLTRVRVLDRN